MRFSNRWHVTRDSVEQGILRSGAQPTHNIPLERAIPIIWGFIDREGGAWFEASKRLVEGKFGTLRAETAHLDIDIAVAGSILGKGVADFGDHGSRSEEELANGRREPFLLLYRFTGIDRPAR